MLYFNYVLHVSVIRVVLIYLHVWAQTGIWSVLLPKVVNWILTICAYPSTKEATMEISRHKIPAFEVVRDDFRYLKKWNWYVIELSTSAQYWTACKWEALWFALEGITVLYKRKGMSARTLNWAVEIMSGTPETDVKLPHKAQQGHPKWR